MNRFFNTAGPVNPRNHYCLPPLQHEGLPQTLEYMDRCGTDEGHLVVFDRTPGKAWEDKLFRRVETVGGKAVTVWGM